MSERLPSEKWLHRIDDSGLHGMIDTAVSQILALPRLDPSEQADADRLRAVLGHVRSRLELADPVLVSESSLNEMTSALSSIQLNLEQTRAAGTGAYLGNAMSMIETLLTAVARLPVITTIDDGAAAVKTFKQSIAGSKAQMTTQLNDLHGALNATEADLNARASALAGELARLEQAVANTMSQAQTTQETQRVSFDEAQASRSSMWEKQLTELRSSLDNTLASARDALQAQANAASDALDTAVAQAEASNQRINTILGIVADKGLVGQYSLTAARERKSVGRWRIAAGLVAIGAIAVAFQAARHASDVNDGSWRPLIAKLAVTAVVAGLAAYCGSVANDHRRAEQTAERTALQLAAIKPYLQDIADVELRDQVMVSTASRMFGVVDANEVGNVPAPTLGSHATAQLSDDIPRMLEKMVEKVVDSRLKP